jgi:acetyltransferase-like isoleucine patch superfamily enzyme
MNLKKLIRFWPWSKNKPSDRRSDSNPIYTNQLINGEDVEIGNFTYGLPAILNYEDPNTYKGPRTKIKIGKFCSIADGVSIMKGGNHDVSLITTYPFNLFDKQFSNIISHPITKGDINIGNDVWIGRDSLVLSGVSIGNGAVIGARTVVSKNVPDYAIAIGNPMKIIKKRFDEHYIEFLLNLQWWDLPDYKLKKIIPFLLSNDIKGLMNYFEHDKNSNK